MIDKQGYRAGIGTIIINDNHRVLWAKRVGQNAWQFPQGGLERNETPEQGMYRELYEEVGLRPEHVTIMAESDDWLYYDLPKKYLRHHSKPLCICQKQKWFCLKLNGPDSAVCLEATAKPEFEEWDWVYYWYPLKKVINFKRDVYRQALRHFETSVFKR